MNSARASLTIGKLHTSTDSHCRIFIHAIQQYRSSSPLYFTTPLYSSQDVIHFSGRLGSRLRARPSAAATSRGSRAQYLQSPVCWVFYVPFMATDTSCEDPAMTILSLSACLGSSMICLCGLHQSFRTLVGFDCTLIATKRKVS